ncbi:MAG: hypothetical protein HUN04_10445 [Desulfobacter sp.]|nr:MAG: hypothetical protein HUN04_10445 [Desulfobacter sp.]
MGKSVDPALVSRFKKEQILDLAGRSLTSVVAHFVLYLFIAVMTPMKSDHFPVLAGFGAAIFFLSGLRLALARKIPLLYDRAPEKWGAVLIAMNVGSGLLWGGLSLVMALYYPLEWPCFVTLVICCGLAAGATSSLGPHQALSRAFTITVLLPITVWAFYMGSSLGMGIGALLVFSMFMYIRMAVDNYLWYWQSLADSEKISKHTRTMERVIEGVNANAEELNRTSKSLSDSSGEMTRNAGMMADGLGQAVEIAEQVKGNSHEMVALMTQASSNFSNIASASEEMTATISDISSSAETTREITANAVASTETAMARMAGLEESATAINQITESIGDISEQINLLALNATIEAARAGEAGKGFAVVATEIKELAVQTSGSAGEISSQVRAIQEATQKAAGVMEKVSSIVREADAKVEGIANAVEEQSAATTEVSRNIQEASQGFSEADRMTGENDEGMVRVSKEMADLGEQAAAVKTGAGEVDRNADALRRLAKEMVSLVDGDVGIQTA